MTERGGRWFKGERLENQLLTATIWRMERRRVAATIVGGNCTMQATLEVI
jgi:hypothetical protein